MTLDDTELIYTVLYLSYTKINSPIFIFPMHGEILKFRGDKGESRRVEFDRESATVEEAKKVFSKRGVGGGGW